MCGKKEDEECSQTSIHNTQGYQEQLFLQQIQQQRYNSDFGFGGGRVGGGSGGEGGLFFSQVTSPILPWNNNNINPNPPFNQLPHFSSTDSFNLPPPPLNLPSSSASTTYGGGEVGGLFNRRGGTLVSANSSTCSALQFAAYYEGGSTSSPHDNHHHHLRGILSEQLGVGVGSLPPFGAHELGKLSAQELMDAKALAASKSHSEAERRRRERINNHLAKLRSLLPSTTKTDKASLLQEVIQHVRELKRQTSQIAETSPVPTETDELVVDDASDMEEDGKFIIKASLCCEDRSDLLPELIKTLKALRLKTLKAEITTLGGRVKNVLFITGEDQDGGLNNSTSHDQQNSISSIQKAFKAIMERTSGEDSSSGSIKRQRTNTINMLQQQQQHMTSL